MLVMRAFFMRQSSRQHSPCYAVNEEYTVHCTIEPSISISLRLIQNSLIIWYYRILSSTSLSTSRFSQCSLLKPIPKSPEHKLHVAHSACSFCSASFCLVRPIEPPHFRSGKPARPTFLFLFVECNTTTPRHGRVDCVNNIPRDTHVMNAINLQWSFKQHTVSSSRTALPRHCPNLSPIQFIYVKHYRIIISMRTNPVHYSAAHMRLPTTRLLSIHPSQYSF